MAETSAKKLPWRGICAVANNALESKKAKAQIPNIPIVDQKTSAERLSGIESGWQVVFAWVGASALQPRRRGAKPTLSRTALPSSFLSESCCSPRPLDDGMVAGAIVSWHGCIRILTSSDWLSDCVDTFEEFLEPQSCRMEVISMPSGRASRIGNADYCKFASRRSGFAPLHESSCLHFSSDVWRGGGVLSY